MTNFANSQFCSFGFSFFLSVVVVVDDDGLDEFLLWLSVKTGDWTCGCFLKAAFLFPLVVGNSVFCMHA